MPQISVVIPTYNRANYICEAIDSVLKQTYQDFEIVVIDDGSIDNTESLILEYIRKYPKRIKYIYQQNKGEAGARNTGIMESTGEYIAFLDSDDIWDEQKLEKQMDYIIKSNSNLVYCNMSIMEGRVIDSTKRIPTKPAFSFFDLLLGGKNVTTGTVLVKKQCMQNIGSFDETFKLACDYEMWLRFSLVYKIGFINQTLAIYRRHCNNLSIDSNKLKFLQTGIIIFKKLLKNPKANKSWVRKRLSLEHYFLTKGYYEQQKYRKAIIELWNCLSIYHLVGLSLINKDSGIIKKIFTIVKPYAFFLYLTLLALRHNK